ncbi:MAG: ATP-dependent helicase HrpB [Akkermansiaceae bacterium]|nr:ATP-dependent helicase HrpB [Akkermansiaceae bacterium]MDP4647406.1 ATP-dependent helicase HrpB [Akkermansiaceae bacterium]MDP4994589.1 ATP-dependent helicase HrpB [Akkermansiaceae bacterium]
MTLPIHEISAQLRTAAAANDRILLTAPTGSGKSTEVPGIIADLPEIKGRVIVIEPRRMAARLLAGFVAKNRNVQLGKETGYAVRFDAKYTRDTKILYLTDGVFQRILQENPNLDGVSAVIFDEFHERRLAVDIALARCLDLQENAHPDLRLIVMSATLETDNLTTYMAPVKKLTAGGRTFPVEILHRPHRQPQNHRQAGPPREVPIWDQVAALTREAIAMPDPGNILIFLQGTHEIRRTIEVLGNISACRPYDIFPLYSALPPAEQERAIAPSAKPKIIVSTNVAETSLTIPGVRTVIDTGLARASAFDPRRGINTLLIRKISRAAADQRAGRAGRTAPGRCLRLWSTTDHSRREEFETPEVHRIDLAEAILLLKDAGTSEPRDFRWFDAPTEASLEKAETLLRQLHATDQENHLTDIGREMAAFPLEPRFARLLLAGEKFGCFAETAFIAAVVQGEGIFPKGKGGESRKDFIFPDDPSDFAGEYRAFSSAEAMNFDPRRLSQLGIHARGSRDTAQIFRRLLALRGGSGSSPDFNSRHEAVAKAILSAFSDQLGIRLSQGNLACRLVGNRRGKLDDQSCARKSAAFVACEITEVEARETITHLRLATAIELPWLEELFPEDIATSDGASYDESRRRVVRRQQKKFRDLVLESKETDQNVPPDAAAEILASRVISGELVLKNWDAQVEQFTHRLACISKWMPELEMPTWTQEDRIAAISQICHGAVSYKEIKEALVWPVLNDWLSSHQRHLLDTHCPERIRLASGHTPKLTYHPENDPFCSAKVAQLVGTNRTPTICEGRIHLLVHILAPNQRPWQMTKDIPNFWANGYPQMKKELAGRYPRHPWP